MAQRSPVESQGARWLYADAKARGGHSAGPSRGFSNHLVLLAALKLATTAQEVREKIRPARLARWTVFLVMGFLPVLALLSLRTPSGRSDFRALASHPTIPMSDPSAYLSHFIAKLMPYLTSFSNFAHRIYPPLNPTPDVPNLPTLGIWCLLLLDLTAAAILFRKVAGTISLRQVFGSWETVFTLSSLAAFAAVLLLVNRSREAWAGHHVILAFPFLMLFWARLIRYLSHRAEAIARVSLVCFAILNCVLFVSTFRKTPDLANDASKVKLVKALRDNSREGLLVVAADWGVYYPLLLYGGARVLVAEVGTAESPDILPEKDLRPLDKIDQLLENNRLKKLCFAHLRHSESDMDEAVKARFTGLQVLGYSGFSRLEPLGPVLRRAMSPVGAPVEPNRGDVKG